MADLAPAAVAATAGRGIGRSLLLTLPVALWALLMFSRALGVPGVAVKVAALFTLIFLVTLFFLMVRTRQTNRWRRLFFATLGFLFPIGFVWELIALRGSMSIPIEKMIAGDTPFCFMVIPMILLPAALTRTVIFPGAILHTASNPHSIALMIGLWMAATLVLGKGWCAYGCFFGGIEEGVAAMPRKARIRKIDGRWRLVPWAVLAAIVLLSLATFAPTYCEWLCPFKTVTEYAEVRSIETAIQAGIFLSLFFGLVIVLPWLTKKRTQCAFFCPFGAFQSLFNKIHIFDIRIRRDQCKDCVSCQNSCPTMALNKQSVAEGKTLINCMHCGACVDICHKDAAVWHIKGTPVGAAPERARLLHLYAAWGFAIMFGGSIIAGTLTKMLGFLG
ncbi:MAG: 4Fe-4S binding protein [Acidobacteria bacterium]|nr:4Fe-4S binding protein [Acidobacteriota bacterium]